jgi:sugar phosphate permease
MDTVYLLWYVREWAEGEDTELLIGVYRTEVDAKDAIGRLKGQPGFVKYPEGFSVVAYELGKDHWTEGFARMLGDKDITDLSS